MALCTSGGAAPSALELDSGHMSRQAAASPMSRLSHAPNTPHSLMPIDGSPRTCLSLSGRGMRFP
jgi:hypothetical protein